MVRVDVDVACLFKNKNTHFFIFSIDKCQFELELCRINAKDTRTTLSVQTINRVALDASDIDRKVQSSDDAMVTGKEEC